MASLRALKVCVTAQTASFRYPRVQIGHLPTFEVPPPATIYGHLAGALGEWFEPKGLCFSYIFEHSGRAVDVETIHPIEKGSGKTTLAKRGWNHPVNVQFSTNVQRRQFLLRPKLTLYLRGDEALLDSLRSAFTSPYFALLLGRSQDLATCLSADFVELYEAPDAFFENTLVPWEWRPFVSPGVTVLLPAAIDYTRDRTAVQERYLHIAKPPLRTSSNDDVTDRKQLPAGFMIDPTDTRKFEEQALPRGLHFWAVQGPGAIA